MADERLSTRFSFYGSFRLVGHASASKPSQAICKPLFTLKKVHYPVNRSEIELANLFHKCKKKAIKSRL